MGHRRWLDINHSYRKQADVFDGYQELRAAPARMSGTDIVSHAASNNLKEVPSNEPLKRLGVLFTLPYWKDNILRHNIDVMHTEKKCF